MIITQGIVLRFGGSAAKMENWRVLLAESQPKLRQNMVKFLTETNGVSLVAKVANGWDVMFTSSQLQPDIVLLDFTMPGLNGTEVASLLKRGLPQVLAVILLNEDENDEGHIKAIEQCGACAYLFKNRLAQDLPPLLSRLEQTKKGNGISN
ncbi:MAG TPA: response regulator transcription factor [Dehalococcoidales bacterium]|nr:response regulator transcription factor [Dehalococcoidales bacterium]